jgi:hypothetical protein
VGIYLIRLKNRQIVTGDGEPVAGLPPLSGPGLSAQALLDRWKNLPGISGVELRADIANGLPLYTRNIADLAGIAGLKVVEVSEDS